MRKRPQPKPEGIRKPTPPAPPPRADGGSAFPRHALVVGEDGVMHVATVDTSGMPLRDYFAAHAPPPPQQWVDASVADCRYVGRRIVAWGYHYADEMMRARKL